MQIVTIFIQNNENQILIQKRSNQKNGKYGITSGHVKENEETTQGALREVKEELGLNLKKEELKLFYNTKIDQTKYNLYHIKKDINLNNLELQKEEVEKVQWCNKQEIEQLIKTKEFYETQIEALEIFQKYMNGGIN